MKSASRRSGDDMAFLGHDDGAYICWKFKGIKWDQEQADCRRFYQGYPSAEWA
jgi:hypothetical protein